VGLFDSHVHLKPKDTHAPSNAERTKASSGEIAARSLESSAKNIARGAKAVRKIRPNASGYSAEFESLVGIADRNNGFCLKSLFQRPCDTRGHEHEVWFAERDGGRVLKATHPNKCGLTLGKDRNALPTQYFRRLALQCRVFGDDIRYECLWHSSEGLRIVTSQPAIRAERQTRLRWKHCLPRSDLSQSLLMGVSFGTASQIEFWPLTHILEISLLQVMALLCRLT
jgi:hypothetical protein